MSFKRFQRKLLRILVILVVIAALFCVGLYIYRSFFGFTYDSSLYGEDLGADIQADKNITNIALFGLDTRPGDNQSHSDCMMIVTVDNKHGEIKLISLMRDSLVSIDGHGEDKLNAAYFLGGPSLAINTINRSFGTDITQYIAVNFEQLVEIVDALDGVEIDVKENELKELNRVIRDYGIEQKKEFEGVESAGKQTLNGVQALCYGRIRKGGTGDDWGRVERQSIVMNAMFQKVQSMNAPKLLRLMRKVMPYVTTSLRPSQVASLAVGAVQNGVPKLTHTRIPYDTEWDYAGASSEYISYDLDTAKRHVHEFFYGDAPESDSVKPSTDSKPTGSDTGGGSADSSVNIPTDGMDFDAPPTGPATPDSSSDSAPIEEDPASLAEEGGRYDAETGDYYDSDGDRYYLDDNGNRVYYANE